MGNSGKSSTTLLVLIPVFFVISLIVVDTIFNYTENKRFKSTTEKIIREVLNDSEINYENYKNEIKRRYERNGYETEMLVVESNDYDVYVENEHIYFGIFSSIFNKKNKESEIKILGVPFKIRKNSVAQIKVNATYDYNNEIIFEYTK